MPKRFIGLLAIGLLFSGCTQRVTQTHMEPDLKKATFAAGCFWGVEKIFSQIEGVQSTSVGYAGGRAENPAYRQVLTGSTGHAEAVEVIYDPAQVSYDKILVTFWEWHDPTTLNRQGPDIGSQYRSAIFFHDPEQQAAAQRTKEALEASGIFKSPIVTEIVPAQTFYRAEEYHQKYLQKNPNGYCSHVLGSRKIRELFKKELSRPQA